MGFSFDHMPAATSSGNDGASMFVPLALAELLHAALGTLAGQLEAEAHPWAAMASRVVDEYEEQRNRLLSEAHGPRAFPEMKHQTFLAAERLCEITSLVVEEALDFVEWSSEVDGETA